MKAQIGLLFLFFLQSCSNATTDKPVSTIDSATTTMPQPDKVLPDTENNNIGRRSEIAIDSPSGRKLIDTMKHR